MAAAARSCESAGGMPPDRVAIVGSGLVGRGWAMVFARAGWDVAVHDADRDAGEVALDWIRDGLDDLARHGLADDPAATAARVRSAPDLGDALDGVSYVQESVPEVLEV